MELYLYTSVIGALFDNENLPRMEITKKLLNSIISSKHIGFISNIVIEEIEKAPSDLKRNYIGKYGKFLLK
ncbi:hypothetical protein KKB18_08685 [bacterium]|nr:hypothetical protein [bacterium]